jgi:hypothetical protein
MAEMRALRLQDPDRWTTQQLAKKYDCSTLLVKMVAKNPEKAARMEAERQNIRDKWGPRRRMAREKVSRRQT